VIAMFAGIVAAVFVVGLLFGGLGLIDALVIALFAGAGLGILILRIRRLDLRVFPHWPLVKRKS